MNIQLAKFGGIMKAKNKLKSKCEIVVTFLKSKHPICWIKNGIAKKQKKVKKTL